MKRYTHAIAIAIAILAVFGLAACDREGAEVPEAVDTAAIDVDSGVIGGREVDAVEKEYKIQGTVTAVNGDSVTIDHKQISDYKPAGIGTFKLASTDMAQHI